ncbi:MAG: PaaI family thioesterase [Deltaproteobacteria bacterium]|nr:PaaI family thioesterase [Deltaproteobacteria bacterium]
MTTGDERAPHRQFFRRRWEANQTLVTGVWAARRRLASAVRAVIERLITSDAPEAELQRAAQQLEDYAEHLESHPKRRRYVGFAESALADAETEDAEAAAGGHFDFSPLIGRSNPLSPPIVMSATEDGLVTGRVVFGSAYEGPPGCVHGGYVAAAFDEVLGFAETFSNAPGMTGTLNVVYRTPTPLHTPVVFNAKIERIEGRKIFVTGELHAGERLCAECSAVFISMKAGTYAHLVEQRAKRED